MRRRRRSGGRVGGGWEAGVVSRLRPPSGESDSSLIIYRTLSRLSLLAREILRGDELASASLSAPYPPPSAPRPSTLLPPTLLVLFVVFYRPRSTSSFRSSLLLLLRPLCSPLCRRPRFFPRPRVRDRGPPPSPIYIYTFILCEELITAHAVLFLP